METQRPIDYSFHSLRLSLGAIYFYFGFLKFFPNLSPAESLASQTIVCLTGGLLSPGTALFSLAVLECSLGAALLLNRCMPVVFYAFLFHMAGTFAPLILFPQLTFTIAPFAPTIEGQYILKNIVFVAVGWPVFLPYAMRRTSPSASKTVVHAQRRLGKKSVKVSPSRSPRLARS